MNFRSLRRRSRLGWRACPIEPLEGRWLLSPLGQIAFESDHDGNFEIHALNANGTGQTRLTSARGVDYFPSSGVSSESPVLTTIELSPTSVTMHVNEQRTFMATGKDQYGNSYTISDPVWTTSGGGTLSPNGTTCTYTATQAGMSEVTCVSASNPTIQGTATVAVTGTAIGANGTLQIVGTIGNDTVTISRSGKELLVEASFLDGGYQKFEAGQVTSIEVSAGGGDDTIQADKVKLSTRIDGGSGDDTLQGGSGSDVLLGGSGDDVLRGGSGSDVLSGDSGDDTLLGGKGSDLLTGGAGNDELSGEADRNLLIGGSGSDQLSGSSAGSILIGGKTLFSDPSTGGTQNQTALSAILAEWSSRRTYTVRCANIRDGSGSTDRLNDNFFLQIGNTVLDDSDTDSLSSKPKRDWYFTS